MFGKLLKHEFRATSRFMWIIYLAMVLICLGSHFSLLYFDAEESAGVLTSLAVGFAVFGMMSLLLGSVITLLLMANRFHKNLLTDEGYLMFTLPTGVHSLIFSKLITAVVWIILTILVTVLGLGLAVMDLQILQEFGENIGTLYQWYMGQNWGMNLAAQIAKLILLLVLSLAGSMLRFYSAMAIGYGFHGHKLLLSVVFYFGIGMVLQVIESVAMALVGQNSIMMSLVSQLVFCAVLYFLTAWSLKKRLNLA